MLDGRPLVDVHLHPARRPTVKVGWAEWARDFGGADAVTRLYEADGTVSPARFDAYLAEEGVDIALVLSEYSPRVTGIQTVEDMLPLAAYNPDRVKVMANVNPNVHYPADEELQRQLGLGAIALKVHPVHARAAANDRALYPAYEICQAAGIPVIVHCGTSTFPGASNTFADPILLDDVLRDFRRLNVVLAHGGRGWWYDAAAFMALSNDRVLDRTVRPAAIAAARVLRPAQLAAADPPDDLRDRLARRARHRPERPRRGGAVPGRGDRAPRAGRQRVPCLQPEDPRRVGRHPDAAARAEAPDFSRTAIGDPRPCLRGHPGPCTDLIPGPPGHPGPARSAR